MNAHRFVEQLAAAGLLVQEIEPKVQLYDRVLAALREVTRSSPEYIVWVPGRLEVFGTHTDYAGGRTLVSAVPKGFVFAGRRRDDGRLTVTDAPAGESVMLDTRRLTESTGWRHYIEIAVDRLARNFPDAALGADLAFASDLPRAAGMSSSSALIVGTAAAIVRLSGIRETPEWRANIIAATDEAGYYACIENGRTFGTLTGNAGVGTHGGSEDHAAMICGEPGAMTAFAFVPMRRLDAVHLPAGWQIIVASSGVAAEKTGNALAPYNRLSRGTAVLLEIWNATEQPMISLAAAIASEPTACARLESHVRSSRVEGWPPDLLASRLRHFAREDARVADALLALRSKDELAIKTVTAASQADAETLLGNQVDETMSLTRLALDHGAIASRSFGAGFGGSVWALVERESPFVERWLDSYRKRHPMRESVAFVAQPGPPLMEFIV